MENITELKRGSLNGLRRQTNECLVSAYYKGYADGKKEPIESHGEQEYNRGIEDASNLLAYADERFIRECFPSESNWDLFDLNAKYGLAVVIKEFKKWQEEKAEEEWKIGDELYSETTNSHAIIVRVNAWNSYECFNDNGIFKITDELKKYWVKIGHFDEVGQLLDKLKGDK